MHSDFDNRWKQMEKRGNLIRRLAMTWIAIVFLLVLSGIGGGVYVLTHPELIGQFVARVVSGLENDRG